MTPAAVDLCSTSLAKASYEDRWSRLRIHFQDGAIYDYAGVPQLLFHALLAAPSKGSFFNQYIRGHFPYRRVDG
jgi:KTSC domain